MTSPIRFKSSLSVSSALLTLAFLLFSFSATFAAPAAPQAAPAGDYAGEPYVVERLERTVRFENDGTGERLTHLVVKILNDGGVEQWGEIIFEYSSASESVRVDYVRVRHADGTTTEAGPSAIQDLTSPVAREAPVYTDTRQKHITVPSLHPGETLEYQIAILTIAPVAPGQFWYEHDFRSDAIVLDESLTVNVPRNRAIKLKTHADAQPAVSDQGDRRIYRWTSSHRKREDEEESALKKKKDKEQEGPAVQFSTFGNWEEIAKWYAPLVRERAVPDPALRAKAEALVAGKTDPLEKMQAIYDYVGRNIRYVSLSFGVGRYQPHSAAEVYANQYGDCKDKHTLLAAMLAAIGYPADAVLISPDHKLDPEIPSPSQFDHVITAVPLNGQLIWMDSTSGVAPFRLLFPSLRKKQALLVPSDGGGSLVETPAAPPFAMYQSAEVTGKVNELGQLTAHVKFASRGDGELALRYQFRLIPRGQWDKIGQYLARAISLDGKVTNLKVSDPEALETPFSVEFDISVPGFLGWDEKQNKLDLPRPGVDFTRPDADNKDPIPLGGPTEVRHKIRIEFPSRDRLVAPVDLDLTRDFLEYHSRYKTEGGVFSAERVVTVRQWELASSKTAEFLALLRAVGADEQQKLTVESSGSAPSIPADAKADDLREAAAAATRSENFAAAVAFYERLVVLEPKDEQAWNDLGRAYLALNETDKAIDALQKQIQISPYHAFAYSNLGLAYSVQRKYPEAEAAFRKQLEINPLDKFALSRLGALMAQQHRYADALPLLEKSASLSPDDAGIQLSLGEAQINVGHTEEGLAAFDRAATLAQSPLVWNNIAYQLALHNLQLDRAQRYAESAVAAVTAELRNLDVNHLSLDDVERVPSIAAYWDTLGWVYFVQGDLPKAEKLIAASWRLSQHGEVGDHLAQIYEKEGRREDAIHTYGMALAAIRPVTESRGRLARLMGGDAKIDPLVNQTRQELLQQRTIPTGRPLKQNASAEFWVVLVPGPSVESVRFINGEELLRPLGEQLRSASFSNPFPDDTPTKLLRRGVLTCRADNGECVFVLELPEDVRTLK